MFFYFRIFLPSLFLFSACAGQRAYYATDRYSAIYHSGGESFSFKPIGSVRGILGSSDESETESQQKNPPVLSREEQAIGGLLLSGLSLAMNQDYYKSPFISGRCLCRSRTAPELEIPCTNVGVILRDLDSEEVRRIQADDGEFMFEVEKDRRYQISVKSLRFQMVNSFQKPLVFGDNVVVHLVPSR